MKANELSLNDLNFNKLEEYFQNESDDPHENENEFETVVTFENEIQIPIENENENGFGNETGNENGNELCCGNENQFGNENETGNELINQMNNEILFYSTEQFNSSEQSIPNPRLLKNHIQVIKIGRTNIEDLYQRYYDTVEYFLLKEYLTIDDVDDFKLATSRLNILNKVCLHYKESEHIEQAVTTWKDKIKEENKKNWYDDIDLFDVNMFILLLIPILILVLAIIHNI